MSLQTCITCDRVSTRCNHWEVRTRKQKRILWNDGHLTAKIWQTHSSDIDTIQQDLATNNVDHIKESQQKRAFAGACTAHYAACGSRRYGEGEALQHQRQAWPVAGLQQKSARIDLEQTAVPRICAITDQNGMITKHVHTTGEVNTILLKKQNSKSCIPKRPVISWMDPEYTDA